jgi:hypothetical protein
MVRVVRKAALLLLALVAAGAAARTAGVEAESGCAASWRVVNGPAVSDGDLEAVAAAATDDVWAVGVSPSVFAGSNLPHRTLIEHWNGKAWTVVAGAYPAGTLAGVAAVDSNTAWAVGSSDADRPLLERWDGAQWRATPVPWNLAVTGVTATSVGDAWAVGDNEFGAMILRWNGTRWVRVARRQKAELDDIAAISPGDIWTVGSDNGRKLLALHWNGGRWNAYDMDAGAGLDGPALLGSVDGTSADDVWAVGSAHVSGLNGYDAAPVVRHWNGSRWAVVRAIGDLDESSLLAVVAPSSTASALIQVAWSGGSVCSAAGSTRTAGSRSTRHH